MIVRAHGADISKYQGRYQPAEPLDFIFQRVSYGLRVDEAFPQLYQDIQPVPLRGGYHYFSSAATWQAQAEHYLELVQDCNYHLHACDMESAYNNVNAAFVLGCIRWMQYVMQETGKKVLLYTNPNIYEQAQVLISPADLAIFDLWIAQYWFLPSPHKDPGMSRLQRHPGDWRFYQYTAKGDGARYGVRSASIDLDVFNGTAAELKKWAKVDQPAPTPVEPEPGTPALDEAAIINRTLDAAVDAVEALRFDIPE